ncbi:MAG: hypothetical protein VX701_07690 [Chloroflexota bacterium]|nr:hypothetical protein [Chloroflexota bacterium]
MSSRRRRKRESERRSHKTKDRAVRWTAMVIVVLVAVLIGVTRIL